MDASRAVEVVPMLAPSTMGSAALMSTTFLAANATRRPVIAEEDCNSVVKAAPAIMPIMGWVCPMHKKLTKGA